MATIDEWGRRLAAEVAPEEADFAPIWVEAFARGGRERRELFAHTNSQAAGFLPGDFVPLLPFTFKAVATAAPALLALLTSELSGKFLECVKNALSLGEVFGKGRGWFQPAQGAEPAAAPAAPPPHVYSRLNEAISKLDKELRPLKLSQAQRDRVSLVVLRLLLEDPTDAAGFVRQLAEKK
jgi:hypothetical protein